MYKTSPYLAAQRPFICTYRAVLSDSLQVSDLCMVPIVASETVNLWVGCVSMGWPDSPLRMLICTLKCAHWFRYSRSCMRRISRAVWEVVATAQVHNYGGGQRYNHLVWCWSTVQITPLPHLCRWITGKLLTEGENDFSAL